MAHGMHILILSWIRVPDALVSHSMPRPRSISGFTITEAAVWVRASRFGPVARGLLHIISMLARRYPTIRDFVEELFNTLHIQ